MKKILYTLTILGVCFGVNAQTKTGKTKVKTASKKEIKKETKIAAAVSSVNTPAAAPAVSGANPNAPKIQFAETEHNFGEIAEGPQAKHDFVIKNTGKEPLIISGCQASCGCTVPQCPKEPILPGQSAKVTAIYNTQGRVGPFTKSITITSNSEQPTSIVYIKGTVNAAPKEQTMPLNDNGMVAPK